MSGSLLRKALKTPLIAGAALLGPHRTALGGSSGEQLWVLMYHRVLPADDPRAVTEEPGMMVTPATLRLHLRTAKQLFTMVSLDEWLTRRAAGKPLPRRACAVTFDDGWLDNYEHALPVLASEGVSATLFVVTEMLGTNRRFWPNRLSDLLGRIDEPAVRNACDWIDEQAPPGTAPNREQLAAIIDHCKQYSDAWLTERLDEAEAKIGLQPSTSPSLVSHDQLQRMVASGCIEVGSHTCNHFRLLPALDDATLRREIVESKRQLQELLDRPVNLFCYPNGDADPRAQALVSQHYRGAVTTRRGINNAGTDSSQLARIGLHEDGSASSLRFQARLSGWV